MQLDSNRNGCNDALCADRCPAPGHRGDVCAHTEMPEVRCAFECSAAASAALAERKVWLKGSLRHHRDCQLWRITRLTVRILVAAELELVHTMLGQQPAREPHPARSRAADRKRATMADRTHMASRVCRHTIRCDIRSSVKADFTTSPEHSAALPPSM